MSDQTPTPYQLGYKEGAGFEADPAANPYTEPGQPERDQWTEGYLAADRKVNHRALAFLSLGTAVIELHQACEGAWGAIMATVIQQSGNGMATIFLGAEATHQGLITEFLRDTEPRSLMEVASHAALGAPLPEAYQDGDVLEEAYRIAGRIREFIKGGDGTQVQIDSAGLMRRIVWGDKPPPEAPVIVPATRMPGSRNPHHRN